MDWDALKERDPELYHIAHDGNTEAEFSGKHVYTTDTGVYHCAVCDAELFSSRKKFDSGKGWPSFTKPIRDAVILKTNKEYGLESIEARCAKCAAHLGRVFHDGPKKLWRTQDRYSLNSVSLVFKKQT